MDIGIVLALANGINSPNFKNEIAKLSGQKAKLPAYHDVWAAMASVEDPKVRLI